MSTPLSVADISAIRAQFPGLVDGVIRLDGPGASQTAQPVLKAISSYLTTSNANLGGAFAHSQASTELVATARERAAAFLGVHDPAEVGFGLNATSLNFALSRAATHDLAAGDEIVVTALDHDANIAPWRQAAADRGLVVRTVGVNSDTTLDMAGLAAAVGPRTRIVAFPYASNATGTAVDVAAVTTLAHSVGAIAWADPTHWAPHFPSRLTELGVDVAICSAYKFFGPHLGLAYARKEVSDRWRSYQLDHAANVSGAARFEHGTPPFESLAGLIAALDYIDGIGWDTITAHERALGQRFLDGLPDRYRLHGLPTMHGRTATFALTLPGRDPQDLARHLAAGKIAAGAGRFHANAIADALNLPGMLRLGYLHYNTIAEVDTTLDALNEL